MSEDFDLASLSIRIDSSEAAAGVESLTKLTGAAEKTEKSTKGVETATGLLAKSMERMVREVAETSRTFERFRAHAKDLELVTAAAGSLQSALGNTAGLQRFNTQLGASDVAMARFQASLADTSAVGRLMGELDRAGHQLREMQAATKAAAAVRDVQRAAETATPPVARLSHGLGGLVGQLAGLTAAGAALRSTTAEALGFSTAMAQVSTLLEADQLHAMDELAVRAKALGAEYGRVPTDQVHALYEIMSAGASDAARATELLRVSNQLAIGGVTQVGVAADGLTSIMASYGAQLRSATQAADAMFVSAADGKTSIEQIARHIGKVAPIASQTGVSLQELLAANAALTKSGIRTETAMEGLRSILAQVAKPSNEARDLARALGVEFTTAGLRARGFAGFMEHLKERTRGSTEQLAVLVGGVEALLPAMALTGTASADFAASLEHMKEASGRTEAAFSKMADTPQFKLDQLRARFSALKIEAGDSLLSAVGPSMDGLLRHFEEVTTAGRYLGEGLAVLASVRAVGWAQEWTQAMAAKAGAARQAREAVANAALADAAYTRRVGESRAAALKAAQAMLEQRQAALLNAAALEGPFTAAHTRAALASNELALAKVREARATEGASLAARAGGAVLNALGGPLGVLTAALGAAAWAYHEFGREAEKSKEKAAEFARESSAAADRGSQVVADLAAATRGLTEQAKAQDALNIARAEFAALGPEYRRYLKDDTDTAEEYADIYFKVNEGRLAAASARVAQLRALLVKTEEDMMPTLRGRSRARSTDEQVKAQHERTIAAALTPINKELDSALRDQVAIERGIQRVREALAPTTAEYAGANERLAASSGAVAAAEGRSVQAMLDAQKAKERAAQRAEEWVQRLEEERDAYGLTREQALKLTDEYKALSESQRERADAALRAIAATKEAEKAEKDRLEVLQELNRELGNPAAEKYAKAQSFLAQEVLQGRLKLEESVERLRKARSLWTPEGKAEAQMAKDMEQLARQLKPMEEAEKRMAMLNQLLKDGRIETDAYRKEMVRLQEQMNSGFDLAKDTLTTVAQAMENAFVEFATTGKFEFRAMVDSILKDMARLLAQKAIMKLVEIGTNALLSTSTTSASTGTSVSAMDVSAPTAMKAATAGMPAAKLYVPSRADILPPGKTGGGEVQMSVQIIVNADGSSAVDVRAPAGKEDAQRMGRALADAMRKVVSEETQPGGIIYSFTSRRRG